MIKDRIRSESGVDPILDQKIDALKLIPDNLNDVKRYFNENIADFPRLMKAIRNLSYDGME